MIEVLILIYFEPNSLRIVNGLHEKLFSSPKYIRRHLSLPVVGRELFVMLHIYFFDVNLKQEPTKLLLNFITATQKFVD